MQKEMYLRATLITSAIVSIVALTGCTQAPVNSRPAPVAPTPNVPVQVQPTQQVPVPGTNTNEAVVVPIQPSTNVVEVTGSNFAFDKKEIRVKKGQSVTIRFVNSEGFHDWVIDEFNARTPQIQAGAAADVTFTPDRTGTFEYYCSVGKHRQMGMKGNLIVE